jgi:sulfonate transport system substrate-binding protein
VVGAVVLASLLAACGSTASGSPTTTTAPSGTTASSAPVDLSGVTLNVADQFKEYETAFAATDALKGAAYKVSWSQFVGGPPIIAAETGGSVDLGDMAETPTIFAQAAGDPVKVVAATIGAVSNASPYGILVPKGSTITTVAQLKGHSIAVQEGTIAQYLLVRMLKKAGVPYSGVTVDNLTFVNGSTAVTSGKVDAALVPQPLLALDLRAGSVRELASGAGYIENLGYLTASQSALDDPAKAAAISVAQTAVASVDAVATPITPAIIRYQQQEADTFYELGLLTQKLDVTGIFDLPFNKAVAAAAGLPS